MSPGVLAKHEPAIQMRDKPFKMTERRHRPARRVACGALGLGANATVCRPVLMKSEKTTYRVPRLTRMDHVTAPGEVRMSPWLLGCAELPAPRMKNEPPIVVT